MSVLRQRINKVAAPKATLTRRTARWILQCLDEDKMSVSAVATALGASWIVVNYLTLSTAKNLVHTQPGYLNGVRSWLWTSTSFIESPTDPEDITHR